MDEANKDTNEQNDKTDSAATAASGTRRAASKATEPASRSRKAAAAKADETASAAKSGAERAADTASGAVHGATRNVEAGRQAVIAASGQVAATAGTAWTALTHHKAVVVGVGAGLTALSAASYTAGRRAERHTYGPHSAHRRAHLTAVLQERHKRLLLEDVRGFVKGLVNGLSTPTSGLPPGP
ncbi:hypothetical protein [Streptomyces sp. NPDC002845]